MNGWQKWFVAARGPFLMSAAIPVLLGTAVAWQERGVFFPEYFWLGLLTTVLLHAGANLANDYFDHQIGADVHNAARTVFNGGAGLLQQGDILPASVRRAALFCLALGGTGGLLLTALRGWPLLFLALWAVFTSYYYTAEPLKLSYRGFGEIVVGLNFGPLSLLAAYYVQTGTFSWTALGISLPVGLLIAAVLWINQFPDYPADKEAGKKNWVVRLGPRRSAPGYLVLICGTYCILTAGIILHWWPESVVLAFGAFPLVLFAWKRLKKYYDEPARLFSAQGATIAAHILTGLLITIGYLL